MMAAVFSNLTFMTICLKEKKEMEIRPMLGACILMMCRARKTRAADNAWVYIEEKRKRGYKLEIPDCAFDEHTEQGRKQGRWWRFWVRQASKLHPVAKPEEIGGMDYSQVMNEFWIKGHQSHQDEPDWNEWDPSAPETPIEAKPWLGVEVEKEEEPPLGV